MSHCCGLVVAFVCGSGACWACWYLNERGLCARKSSTPAVVPGAAPALAKAGVGGHTDAFTHRPFYTHRPFTHRNFYTDTFTPQTLLNTDGFSPHRRFYTQTLLHTGFHTQKLLHADAFTPRRFDTDGFTYRRFYAQKLLHTASWYRAFFWAIMK